jgi:tripartite-type tricarboxylate transporter receptor subunit TctC
LAKFASAWARTLAGSLLLLTGSAAHAQEAWPTKRITFLVGFSAGGFADTVARLIANNVSQRLKQSIIVQNMDGAGGNTAARQITVSNPDGYSFLITTTGVAINDSLFKVKPVDTAQLAPVAVPVSAPEALTSNPKSGFKTFAEMIAAAKEGRVYMGTPGIGSGSHIAAEYFFKKLANVTVKHIPFAGGTQSMQALMVGDINVRAATVTNITVPAINSGELVGLAVASEQRDPALPNVPTFAEVGYPGHIATNWVGFFARTGTPEPILARMNAEINAALNDPDIKAKMDTLSLMITSRDRPATVAFFKDEIARWARMVEATGLSM